MEQEAERVHEAGAALGRISAVAEHSARLVDGISRSANDQVVATQELVRSMQRIRRSPMRRWRGPPGPAKGSSSSPSSASD
jgi:methyl-accepting chemotaxis protein